MSAVQIVATGVANVASVQAALARVGLRSELVRDAAAIVAAPRLVLPGVGAFGAGMAALRERGLTEALRERLGHGLPTLAICLGMQLCCEASEESPGVRGLGIVPGVVRRFAGPVRVPQLGWNRVTPVGENWCEAGHAYFANSYCLRAAPAGWQVATADHGGEFVASLRRGAVWLCQFHPEISGAFGQRLLAQWIAMAPTLPLPTTTTTTNTMTTTTTAVQP